MSADLERRRSLLTAALGFTLLDAGGKPEPPEQRHVTGGAGMAEVAAGAILAVIRIVLVLAGNVYVYLFTPGGAGRKMGAMHGARDPADRGAALVGCSLMSSARGESSTINVIFTRVATEPRLLHHMVSRYGMPRSALACAGVLEWDCRHDVAEFRAWVADRGRSSYVRLLLTHPGFAARSAFRSWHAAVGGVGVERDGDLERLRREQARQLKVKAMPLIEGLGSSHWLVRSVAKGCARLTFTWLIERLGPSAGRVLSAVPFVVLAVLLVASHTIRCWPRSRSTISPSTFFCCASHGSLIARAGPGRRG